jgi:hypothetical protein
MSARVLSIRSRGRDLALLLVARFVTESGEEHEM